MAAYLVLKEQRFEVRHGMSINSALKKLNIPFETVLPTRRGELVHEETLLKKDETIILVSVMSSG